MAAALLAAASSSVGAVTVDFESGTFLQEIGDTFASQGVRFGNFDPSDVSTGPVFNRVLSVSPNLFAADLNIGTTSNVTAFFDFPLASLSAGVIAPVGRKVTMTGFDASGNVVSSVTTPGVSGTFGVIFETLTLSGEGIVTVRWETDDATLAAAGVDNIVFSFALAGLQQVATSTALRASTATMLPEQQRQAATLISSSVLSRIARRIRPGWPSPGATPLASVYSDGAGLAAGDDILSRSMWLAISDANASNSFVSTAFESDSRSVMLGGDMLLSDDVLLGGSVSFERGRANTFYNAGTSDANTYNALVYGAYNLNDYVTLDGLFGVGRLTVDQTRSQFGATISSDVRGRRVFAAGNVTAYFDSGPVLWDVTTGLLAVQDRLDSFTESNGLVNPGQRSRLLQWRAGVGATVPVGAWALYANGAYAYDVDRTEVTVGPGQAQPDGDRDELQAAFGVRYLHEETLTASFEYSTVLSRENFESDAFQAQFHWEF